MRTKLLEQELTDDVVSLEEAMEHSRITDDWDELVVQACLDAAHDAVQSWLNRKLYPSLMVGQVNEYRTRITLPYPPIKAVSYVTAECANGDTIDLVEGTDWKFDSISETIRFLKPQSNLSVFEFQYECGYESVESVPKAVKHAILMTFATLYNNREDAVVGASVASVPLTAHRLLRTHRVRGHM